MKKLLVLFVMLCVSTIVNAQFDLSCGPKIGYQAAKLTLDKETIKSDFRGNMTLGVFGRVAINKLVLQPELLFSRSSKLVEVYLPNKSENPTLIIKQNNFVLPIHMGYQFLDLDFIKMRATVAPVFYFSVGKTKVESESFNVKAKGSLTEDVSVGAALNAGIDIWRFTFDVGYCFGLTETMDDDIELPFDIEIGDGVKQNVFIVSFGFKFL